MAGFWVVCVIRVLGGWVWVVQVLVGWVWVVQVLVGSHGVRVTTAGYRHGRRTL